MDVSISLELQYAKRLRESSTIERRQLYNEASSVVGTDISQLSLNESKELVSKEHVQNVEFKRASAFELTDHFLEGEFDVCMSIDMIEHLHPDDEKDHLWQAFHLLKSGGRYIVCMPNRLNGPHAITRFVFPEAKAALGFHLNELTCREITLLMKSIGFAKFSVFYPLAIPSKGVHPIVLPYQLSIFNESLYEKLPKVLRARFFQKFLSIHPFGFTSVM